MKFSHIILLTILLASCSKENDPFRSGEVTVTFTYDLFVPEEVIDNFRTKDTWEHVFGGTGHVEFTEVGGSFIVEFQFDGGNLSTLKATVPPGTYDISMWFDATDMVDFFPFTATATNVSISENTTIELTADTEYALILVDSEDPVGSRNPWFDGNKDGNTGSPSDFELDQMTGNYYYGYFKVGLDGDLWINYYNDAFRINTNIVVESKKVDVGNKVRWFFIHIIQNIPPDIECPWPASIYVFVPVTTLYP